MEPIPANSGIINKPSPRSVADTIDRLEALASALGMTIFARIDQRAAAVNAGLTLRPTQLLIFGDPKSGTPLMAAHPSLALDLPLKALVWEDDSGQVWLTYNSPEYLWARHSLPVGALKAVDNLMDKAVAEG